jgi:monomeric sarcosine oxidase
MSRQHYDVIVLGTGGVGSAALYQLASRGLNVLGLDRFPPGHDRGSSHGETRMIRLSYFEHADYVPLLQRTYTLWDKLDPSLLRRSGVYYVGREQGEVIQGVRQSASQHKLRIEEKNDAPPGGFLIPADATTLFEPDAGLLPVEQCIKLHLSKAVALGAEHRWGDAVLGWEETDDSVSVSTDAAQFEADRLIIAAGSWAGEMLAGLGLPLRILRKHLHWFETGDAHSDSGFFYELEHGQFYGFPTEDGLIKLGEHTGGEVIEDPLLASREPDPEDTARVADFVRDYLPGAGRERRHAVCFYTMTPDGQFIVDRVPGSQRVAFAAGLSGHGFKFTPVLGEILADLVLEGRTDFEMDFLGLDRLRR